MQDYNPLSELLTYYHFNLIIHYIICGVFVIGVFKFLIHKNNQKLLKYDLITNFLLIIGMASHLLFLGVLSDVATELPNGLLWKSILILFICIVCYVAQICLFCVVKNHRK